MMGSHLEVLVFNAAAPAALRGQSMNTVMLQDLTPGAHYVINMVPWLVALLSR